MAEWILNAFDASDTALTVSWSKRMGVTAYEVQYRRTNDQDSPDAWLTLSDKLTTSIVRKKNLHPGTEYSFRVRALKGDWGDFSAVHGPFRTLPSGATRLPAPTLVSTDSEAVTVTWDEVPGAEGYNVELWPEDESRWEPVSVVVKSNRMRKKNLRQGVGYAVRVRPIVPGQETYFSEPSAFFRTAPLAPSVSGIFKSSLVCHGPNGANVPVPTAALAGKVVAIYVSASWCGPCRQFTPMLIEFYNQLKSLGKPFEVVFSSADRDERSFGEYYSHMPWLAVDYDEEQVRDTISRQFQVQGIPRLIVLGPGGHVVCNDGRAVCIGRLQPGVLFLPPSLSGRRSLS